jgi:hypothetical protein
MFSMPMTGTQRKLERARYFLGKAKNSANEYDDFVNNLDALITNLNSVWDIVRNEFNGVSDFNEWYDKKDHELFALPIVKLFREERRLTEHIKPFEAGQDDNSYYTDIQEEFIVRGGATKAFQHQQKTHKVRSNSMMKVRCWLMENPLMSNEKPASGIILQINPMKMPSFYATHTLT